ncbi:hypothetical protein ACFQWC_14810 [Rossellomorea sp. GCM10028870]|uniref:hypothetical protein n=1 Tax=Rossellomorea sp. GCM10028870 TaxID=3273426 RepID=UPI003606A8FD
MGDRGAVEKDPTVLGDDAVFEEFQPFMRWAKSFTGLIRPFLRWDGVIQERIQLFFEVERCFQEIIQPFLR